MTPTTQRLLDECKAAGYSTVKIWPASDRNPEGDKKVLAEAANGEDLRAEDTWPCVWSILHGMGLWNCHALGHRCHIWQKQARDLESGEYAL